MSDLVTVVTVARIEPTGPRKARPDDRFAAKSGLRVALVPDETPHLPRTCCATLRSAPRPHPVSRLVDGAASRVQSQGRLTYGKGVRLGEGTRIDLLSGSLLDIGDSVIVGRNAYFSVGQDGQLNIGAGTAVQDMCRFLGNVAIGKGCIFAPNVFISSGTYTFDALPRSAYPGTGARRARPQPSGKTFR